MLNDQKQNLLRKQVIFDSQMRMTELVEDAKNFLLESDLESFGKTMNENWQLKKSLSNKISNTDIDDLYSLAINNGAIGGKILGAGGGGFFLIYCPVEKQNRLRSSLKMLREFEFNFCDVGSVSLELNH